MRYLKKSNYLVLIFLFFSINLFAQLYPSKNISTTDGLTNNTIFKVFKDSRNILWVGTNNGLSKIENNIITNFSKEDGLAHNRVWDITEDEKGNLWFASYGNGITKYDGKHFKIFSDSEGITHKYIRKVFSYKHKILVGAGNGLFVVNIEDDSVKTIYTGEEKFQTMNFFVYKDEIYCGAYRAGIFKIDLKQKKAHKIEIQSIIKKRLFSVNLENKEFYYGVDGGTSKFTKGAILKFNIDSLLIGEKEELIFGKSILWEYSKDNDNNLYGAAWGVHTNDGGVYQIKEDVFINRTLDFGIKSNNIRAIYIDKQFNTLYAGSLDKGVYKVNLETDIRFFDTPKLDIESIVSDKGKMFFLHKNGVSVVENHKTQHQVSSNKLYDYAKANYKKNRFKEPLFGWTKRKSALDIVYHKIIYKDNSLWISTNIGVYQVSTDGAILNYYPILVINFDFDFNNGFINPIPYRETVIYTSLKDQIKKEYSLKDINTPRDISSIIKAENKIFVASNFKGLFVLQNGNFKSLKNAKLFEGMELNHLAITDDLKTLVISSVSGDVFLANIENEFILNKTIPENLIIGNSILFLETYKNVILIGTEKGLNVFNGKKFQFIDEEQGFKSGNYTSSKIVGDHLIVGTDKGYYELNLGRILYRKQADLKLNISDLYVNHLKYDKSEFNWFNYNKNKLVLNYNENTISIDYKASNHPYPNKLLYSYQLKGLDTTWSKYSNKTNILLPYVPSGEFKIKVKVKDLNSGEISISTLLSVVVTPPFWKTWWFIISTLLIAVLIGFFVYKKRIKYITNREAQKSIIQQRIVETKLEALQSQMNPHFTFNAMNSIQNYIIDNDIDNALMYLAEFAKLIRKTLDNSALPLITLSEEISYLQSYIALENMRHNNSVEVEINYAKIDLQEIDIPPMLIQPFVENVFVHAFTSEHINPKLTIEFTIENEFLVCKITDNGSGMSKTLSGQIHQSKGLTLVKERLNLLNKSNTNSFQIETKLGNGTSITLQLEIPNYND